MTARIVWHPIESAPEGRPVLTKVDDHQGERNQQIMTREGRMWWIAGKLGTAAMYVYYTPTHWAEP